MTAGAGVDDQQDGGENAKDEDGAGQHQARWIPLDEGSDENGSHALKGLIQAGEEADLGEGIRGRAGFESIIIVAFGGQRGDGAVEGLQPELVQHDPGDVDGYVALLRGREDIPAVANGHLCHRCGVRQ